MYLPSKAKFKYTALLVLAALLVLVPFKHVIKSLSISFPKNIHLAPKRLHQRIKELEKINLSLSLEIEKFKRLKKENQTLRKVFNFKNEKGFDLVGADVVLFSPSSWRRFVEINSGKNKGLKKGLFAIDENGKLIGKITQVSEDSAQVILVNDPDFNLSVFIGEKGFGLLKGALSGAKILYVEDGNEMHPGDKVWLKNPSLVVPVEVGTIAKVRRNPNNLFWDVDVELPLKNSFFEKLFIIK